MDELIRFMKLVEKLRTAQQRYFRTRENRYLLEAKQWEREVDKEIKVTLYPDTQEKLEL